MRRDTWELSPLTPSQGEERPDEDDIMRRDHLRTRREVLMGNQSFWTGLQSLHNCANINGCCLKKKFYFNFLAINIYMYDLQPEKADILQ